MKQISLNMPKNYQVLTTSGKYSQKASLVIIRESLFLKFRKFCTSRKFLPAKVSPFKVRRTTSLSQMISLLPYPAIFWGCRFFDKRKGRKTDVRLGRLRQRYKPSPVGSSGEFLEFFLAILCSE